MKQLLTLCASVVLASGALANNEEGTTRYKVDASASSITWHATKVTGEHMGTVNVANGYLSVEDGTLIAANIIANMETIACTDLEGEWGDKLVGHLNSDDFFNVSEHKTARSPCATLTLESRQWRRDAQRHRRLHHSWHHQERDL